MTDVQEAAKAPGSERVLDNGDGTITPYVAPNQGAIFRTNAGGPAPGQSNKSYTGKQATSASVATTITLETVATGKTLYITDIYFSYDDTAQHDTRLQAGGVDIFRCVVKGDTAPVEMAGMQTEPSASAGQAVTILLPIIAGAPNFYFYVAGIEQ